MKKKWLAFLVSVIIGIAGTILISTLVKPPRQAPDVTFELLDGRRVALNTYQGRPVLVLFWATSCKICIEEIPGLIRLYREFKPRGFELIAVAMPYDPPSSVKAFNDQYKLPYPIALDVEGKVYRAFGDVPGTPTFYLINDQGRIVLRASGRLDLPRLRRELTAILQPGRPPA